MKSHHKTLSSVGEGRERKKEEGAHRQQGVAVQRCTDFNRGISSGDWRPVFMKPKILSLHNIEILLYKRELKMDEGGEGRIFSEQAGAYTCKPATPLFSSLG